MGAAHVGMQKVHSLNLRKLLYRVPIALNVTTNFIQIHVMMVGRTLEMVSSFHRLSYL